MVTGVNDVRLAAHQSLANGISAAQRLSSGERKKKERQIRLMAKMKEKEDALA